jgi:hypothetical protein
MLRFESEVLFQDQNHSSARTDESQKPASRRVTRKRDDAGDQAHNSLRTRAFPSWAKLAHGVADENSGDAGEFSGALSPGADELAVGGAFSAGAGLALLDQVLLLGGGASTTAARGLGADVPISVGAPKPPFVGALRQRLALRAGAACGAMLRLREDEGNLRDAEHLSAASEHMQSSPSGRIHRLWRMFAARPVRLETPIIRTAAEFIGLPQGADFAALTVAMQSLCAATPNPLTAASLAASMTVRSLPDAPHQDVEILALWLADVVLSKRLGWEQPVPLIATRILDRSLRRGPSGKRAGPRDPDWPLVLARAYALAACDAYALASDLSRRSERLLAVAPKLRAKGAGRVVELLLSDDAVSPARAARASGLSDRAARRLFDRLIELKAARELSGRTNFRLYGL